MDKCNRPTRCARDTSLRIVGRTTVGLLLGVALAFSLIPGADRSHASETPTTKVAAAATQGQSQDKSQDHSQEQSVNQPSIAFHYGQRAPLNDLRVFNRVVVDPGHGHDPAEYREKNDGQSELLAYVSIGEVLDSRSYRKAMPTDMLAGKNATWGSHIINQAHPGWPEFFVYKVVQPLWQQGYRGFFLDTMDSYQAIQGDEKQRAAQRDGLINTINLLKRRYPDATLITNRGFELLARLRGKVDAIAAESLFGRWEPKKRRYLSVPKPDREWLLARFKEVQEAGMQAIAIDYADPGKRDEMRALTRRILHQGITPYVTDGDLITTGMGRIEVVPRRVLVVHNGTQDGDEAFSPAHLKATMPLHYLGMRVDLLDINRYQIPDTPLADRYAAVVGIFEKTDPKKQAALTRLFLRAKAEDVPLVLLNSLGVVPNSRLGLGLGISQVKGKLRRPLRVGKSDPNLVGYEIPALPDINGLALKAPSGSRSLLNFIDNNGQDFDGVAVTPWGGFAVRPFTFVTLGEKQGSRWVIDPIAFMEQAVLRGRFRPMPDPTTENGRRLFLVHIDGDGFASRAEIPGTPFAAEIMYRDFIARYKVPHTVSIIEGETGKAGLYPELSATLEPIARDIFKLDHVEIATHSYSHPFFWNNVVANAANGIKSSHEEKLQHLPIEGYDFDLVRDINGSAAYIDNRLAPPGKKTKVFLWTGDTVPPAAAIAQTARAGLLNMNGGDTVMTRANPSLALVAPLSLRKDGWLQVLAPNQNENVYTNDWTGPFYGFDRVIETFEMTNAPRRLKPVNIYYHTYSASKTSAITALHRVYRYAMRKPLNPVYGSEYIMKVHDFEDMTTARDVLANDGREIWHLAGNGDLKTMRIDSAMLKRLNWMQSTGVVGHQPGVDGTYLHLSGARTRLVFEAADQPLASQIMTANGRIDDFKRSGQSFSFVFTSHVEGRLKVAHPKRCRVKASGKRLRAKSASPIKGAAMHAHDYRFKRARAQQGIAMSVSC